MQARNQVLLEIVLQTRAKTRRQEVEYSAKSQEFSHSKIRSQWELHKEMPLEFDIQLTTFGPRPGGVDSSSGIIYTK